jgi:hypothetical protein
MGSGGLRLGVPSLLDDDLEPSTEGNSLNVIRCGEAWGREPMVDEQ